MEMHEQAEVAAPAAKKQRKWTLKEELKKLIKPLKRPKHLSSAAEEERYNQRTWQTEGSIPFPGVSGAIEKEKKEKERAEKKRRKKEEEAKKRKDEMLKKDNG
ncbi:hypothetical protein PFISCL1PPCAC_17734, partial [Pristionchus fissidentatus]